MTGTMTTDSPDPINFPTFITKFDEILSRGLCQGVGDRDSQMCIEAAICAALDLPHGDNPDCVAEALRRFKICLNDSLWSSPEARAKGLRNIGIAQVGSKGVVDDVIFAQKLAEATIRTLIPHVLRTVFPHDIECLRAADECEKQGSAAAAAAGATARAAARAADAAAYADADAAGYADAARAAAAAAGAAAYAAGAAADAAGYADADAAGYAAAYAAAAGYAAAGATGYAAAGAAAYAAGYAAAAAAAADAAGVADADFYLIMSAQIGVDVLRELNSPGCAWI